MLSHLIHFHAVFTNLIFIALQFYQPGLIVFNHTGKLLLGRYNKRLQLFSYVFEVYFILLKTYINGIIILSLRMRNKDMGQCHGCTRVLVAN